MNSLVVVLLILLLLGAFGGMPHFTGHGYGYWPSGALGVILLVLIILLIAGRL